MEKNTLYGSIYFYYITRMLTNFKQQVNFSGPETFAHIIEARTIY
jgi:hypothetical protein